MSRRVPSRDMRNLGVNKYCEKNETTNIFPQALGDYCCADSWCFAVVMRQRRAFRKHAGAQETVAVEFPCAWSELMSRPRVARFFSVSPKAPEHFVGAAARRTGGPQQSSATPEQRGKGVAMGKQYEQLKPEERPAVMLMRQGGSGWRTDFHPSPISLRPWTRRSPSFQTYTGFSKWKTRQLNG